MSRVLLTHEIMCRFATFAISARISPSKCFHAQVFRPFFLQTMYPEHKTLMVLLLLSEQTFTLTILQRTLKLKNCGSLLQVIFCYFDSMRVML